MRASPAGKKSFPGGRRFWEDPSHPKAPGVLGEASLDDGRSSCTHPRRVTLKLPARRETRTLPSEERNGNVSEQSPQHSHLTAIENCCLKT